MSQQVLDMRALTTEQALRLGRTFAAAKFIEDFVKTIYAYSDGNESTADIEFQGWTLGWRLNPTPRIQVRTVEAQFYELVKAALIALGYDVRNKGDHLVVIL